VSRIKPFHSSLVAQLQAVYPLPEAEQIAYQLLDFYLGLSKVDIALDPNAEIEISLESRVNTALLRLLDHEPLQYVLGEAYFYDLTFSVDGNVLIPRPETEELVKLVMDRHSESSLSILDIGTGSGCIPISIKKHKPRAHVSACDISLGALELAKVNGQRNAVVVDFFYCDILDASHWTTEHYDVIVSNPPYVLNSEKAAMRENVLGYEPHLALFVEDDDPLLFYKAIADFALQSLNTNGHLYFEINEAFGAETQKMLEDKGYRKVRLHSDIFGKARMVSAVL
jgi:release factor glutamine methyltransferase